MIELYQFPQEIKQILNNHDVSIEDVLVTGYTDMDQDMKRKDTYFAITEYSLWMIERDSVNEIPLSEIKDLRIEELISTNRLLCERESISCLAVFSNTWKSSMVTFIRCLNDIKDGKLEPKIQEEDLYSSKFCPKCGTRYPDAVRKICPHCMKKGRLFQRFFTFFLRYKKYLAISIVALAALTALSLVTPYVSSGFFYDEVIYGTGEFYGQILLVLYIVIATKLLHTIAQMIHNHVSSSIAARVVFDLKKTIFTAIDRLSLSFFTDKQTGGLMTQVNDDSETIYTFFCDTVPSLIVNIVKIIVIAVLLLIINPWLACITFLTLPIYFILNVWSFKRHRIYFQRIFKRKRSMDSLLADNLSGVRVVKAFAGENKEIERFHVSAKRVCESANKNGVFTHTTDTLIHSVLNIASALAYGFGGWLVITKQGLSYGVLLTYIAYVGMIFAPLQFFVTFFQSSADCSNAMQRLFEIMDAKPDVVEAKNALSPENLSGKVEFDNVDFSYQKGRKVIDSVSFTVEDGEILGIVGHTGAGKSTIANLLMRLYEADNGEIRIGGYPIKQLSLESIYRNIAIVSQETYLFMGSILENIRYARPEATFEEVLNASKAAGAHDFIMRLPDSYDTRVGIGNQELSGGEKQRISIARAILKNPKILILDEATSAMDTQTERRIQEALEQLVVGKTTIMIAHRLSTLRDANQLVVIEHGKVAEKGTHEELLQKEKGVYKKLFTLQEDALIHAGVLEEVEYFE